MSEEYTPLHLAARHVPLEYIPLHLAAHHIPPQTSTEEDQPDFQLESTVETDAIGGFSRQNSSEETIRYLKDCKGVDVSFSS